VANPFNEAEPFNYSGTSLGSHTVRGHVTLKTTGDSDVDCSRQLYAVISMSTSMAAA
jgi:hypothetical protein